MLDSRISPSSGIYQGGGLEGGACTSCLPWSSLPQKLLKLLNRTSIIFQMEPVLFELRAKDHGCVVLKAIDMRWSGGWYWSIDLKGCLNCLSVQRNYGDIQSDLQKFGHSQTGNLLWVRGACKIRFSSQHHQSLWSSQQPEYLGPWRSKSQKPSMMATGSTEPGASL